MAKVTMSVDTANVRMISTFSGADSGTLVEQFVKRAFGCSGHVGVVTRVYDSVGVKEATPIAVCLQDGSIWPGDWQVRILPHNSVVTLQQDINSPRQ